jgi:hypothetical protein
MRLHVPRSQGLSACVGLYQELNVYLQESSRIESSEETCMSLHVSNAERLSAYICMYEELIVYLYLMACLNWLVLRA